MIGFIKFTTLIGLFILVLSMNGCSKSNTKSAAQGLNAANDNANGTLNSTSQNDSDIVAEVTPSADIKGTLDKNQSTKIPSSTTSDNKNNTIKGKIICIDAGHQSKGDATLEPIAPDSQDEKQKMATGTSGIVTKTKESVLNLQVSLRLQTLLEKQGYEVVMIRTTEQVNISNAERAQIANKSGAEVLIRIHADGSENQGVRGISILYPGDRYIKDTVLLTKSKDLSNEVSNSLTEKTGVQNIHQVKRDDLTGFNWLKIPSILVEMGFMTNPDEDRLLATDEYQNKIVSGIEKGLSAFLIKK